MLVELEIIKKQISEIKPWLIEIRREFHMYPELGMKEHKTGDIICRELDKIGVEYTREVGNTGIVGIIRGNESGKTVALRADIDALPIEEANKITYRSMVKGKMHACGHDAHTAIVLGCAKIITQLKDELKGNVKLFFQPAEETDGGALPMIKDGCMKDPKVDYTIGLHVAPYINTGKIEIKYGKLNASSDTIKIIIKGRKSHCAYPEAGVDAIVIAGQIITVLQTIMSRNISPLDSAVLSFGIVNGGTVHNVLCDYVELTGTLRTYDVKIREYLKDRIKQAVEGLACSMGGEGKVIIEKGYMPLINDSDVVDVIKENGEYILGKENMVYKEKPSLGVEDFSFFTHYSKAAFYHLGCRNEEKGITAPLHSDLFNIDEDCLEIGVLLQIANAIKLLSK